LGRPLGASAKEDHQEFIENLFKDLTILPFDSRCAKEAKSIYCDLRSKNKLIELADILIASTAMANDLSLITMNSKHFGRIESLKTIELG
jgi:tRNA(fMet)-specific endonuclease VapC